MSTAELVGGEIIDERLRQIRSEGWSAEHDDKHDSGQLIHAAIGYQINAVASTMLRKGASPEATAAIASREALCPMPAGWPWARNWWKPKSRRRDLVRAAALLIAEIERIDREEGT